MVRVEFGSDNLAAYRSIGVARFAPPNDAGRRRRGLLDRETYGMAISSRLAMVKAVSEAYERHACGVVRHDVMALPEELGSEWLDPRIATPFTAEQYAQLPALAPFGQDSRYQWLGGYRASTGAPVYVPVEHVFYPVGPRVLGRKPCYMASSSGVAAHPLYDEAKARALLELVERDAFGVTWYAQREVNALDPTSLNVETQTRIAGVQAAGWEAKLLDLTLDSVPVVLAILYSRKRFPHLVCGSAAAWTLQEAVTKAWDEAELMQAGWSRSRGRPRLRPEQVVSTIDHGKFYFRPSRLTDVAWLLEAPVSAPAETWEGDLFDRFDPVVIDIASTGGAAPLQVVRVISERLLPINFGYGTEHYSHTRLADLGLRWSWPYPALPHLLA